MSRKKVKLFTTPGSRIHLIQKLLAIPAMLAISLTIYFSDEPKPFLTSLFFIAVYLFLIWVIAILHRAFSFKIDADPGSAESPTLNSLTFDFISRVYAPISICDTEGKIVLYNKALAELLPTGELLYGRYIDQYCTATVPQIDAAQEYDGLPVAILPTSHGHNQQSYDQNADTLPHDFRVKSYPFVSAGKNYRLLFWNDKRDLRLLQTRMAETEAVVGYILIDNLDETLQYMQEQYRMVTVQVESLLSKWMSECNGLIKEYERNKFLVMFEARYLKDMVDKHFPIMDTVHEIRIGESNTPVTISLGIAHIEGTLSQKEEAAHAALDLALQRGGDQVVYKTDNGTEFYGGRTKSVQKRTKVRSRVFAGELAALIAKSSNVLIMGHRFADHDSIGSCIGIYKFTEFCGVRANVVVNKEDPNIRVCLDRFFKDTAYSETFVESAAALDLITSETLLIICDVSNPLNFEAPELYENVKNTVIIDHHRKTGDFKYKPLLTYIEPSASSASELVSEMLEQSIPLGALPKEEADLLLSGILLDTNQFTRNTGVRTFSAALYLRSEGASPSDAKMLFRTSLDDFVREAKFASNVIIYRDIISIAVRDGDGTTGDDRIAAAKAADSLLAVNGVMASFALVRLDDTVHISARSQGNLNVQLILERLRGGGHYDVAGAQVSGHSMEEVLVMLKEAIDAYLSDISEDF